MKISTEYIRLEQFLKFCGLADTGGQAKLMIREGLVKVNGEKELRRGKKLVPGDRVEAEGRTFTVE
jgi:ribosome-associated protein